MGGLLDPVTDVLFGGSPSAGLSGAFPGLGELGKEFSAFLLDRLKTPASETESYRYGTKAIRDALTATSKTARQRLGDTANTRGFLDSGAVYQGLTDIELAEAQSFAESVTALYLGLEDRREQNVLPYLSGGASESAQIQGINVQSSLSRDNLQAGLLTDLLTAPLGDTGLGGIFR